MSEDRDPEKQQLHTAYAGVHESVARLLMEGAALARYGWNMEMRLLKAVGVMPLFVSRWWLFIVLGFALLAFVPPVGLAFLLTAMAAGQMDPSAKNEFIVPLKLDG